MPGKITRAVSSLQQIEERLRRALGLVGDIGTRFDPKAIPVVISADATEVGNNIVKGRAFAGIVRASLAVAGGVVFKFPNACIVDAIGCTVTTAAVDINLNLAPADAGADPIATATLFASWIELNEQNASRAPVFCSAMAALVANGNFIDGELSQANVRKSFLCAPIHVMAGTRLIVHTVAAGGWGAATVGVRGRLL